MRNATKLSAIASLLCAFALLAATMAADAQAPAPKARQAPDTGKARLYFIRESSLMYIAGTPAVQINGQEVGRPGSGSYFVVERPPGRYDIVLDTTLVPGRFAANINVKAPGTYYFKVVPRAYYFPILWDGPLGKALDIKLEKSSGSFGSGAFGLLPLTEKAANDILTQMKAPRTKPVSAPDRT